MLILFNNKFVKKALVNINGPAGRGYGIFETMRTFNKNIHQEKEHLARLFSSAKRIELKINYKKIEITQMLKKITKKSPFKNQRIKITALPQNLIITSEQLKIDPKIYEKGVSLKSIVAQRGLPEVKSISYLPSYLSHERAVKQGYFEALLIDKNEEVYECAYHNIFWFEKNTLCTRKNEVLPGTISQLIARISPFKLKYKTIKLPELLRKEEIFITNSINIIIPVIKIDKTTINKEKSGEKTILLYKKLTQQVASSYVSANTISKQSIKQ